MRKYVLCHANNKGADQPAHPLLASVAAQAGLCLAWLETPEDTFCHVVAHLVEGFTWASG